MTWCLGQVSPIGGFDDASASCFWPVVALSLWPPWPPCLVACIGRGFVGTSSCLFKHFSFHWKNECVHGSSRQSQQGFWYLLELPWMTKVVNSWTRKPSSLNKEQCLLELAYRLLFELARSSHSGIGAFLWISPEPSSLRPLRLCLLFCVWNLLVPVAFCMFLYTLDVEHLFFLLQT